MSYCSKYVCGIGKARIFLNEGTHFKVFNEVIRQVVEGFWRVSKGKKTFGSFCKEIAGHSLIFVNIYYPFDLLLKVCWHCLKNGEGWLMYSVVLRLCSFFRLSLVPCRRRLLLISLHKRDE